MRHLTASAAAIAILLAGFTPALGQPAAAPAVAGQPVAETPASDLARRILKAAAGSDDAFIALMREVDPKSKRTDEQLRGMRGQLAALRLHAVERATPTEADATVYDSNLETWARMTVLVTPDAPHTLAGIRMMIMASPPADAPPAPKLTPAQFAAAARAHAEAAAKDDRFSGAILIARNGKPILDAAFGLANRETKTPTTTDSQFRFGSMGKMFTAVSIMQLVQAGKIDLTAPIGRYLPGYPNAEIAEHVTVANLLSHSGGTGDIFGPEFTAHRLDLKDAKDYVALYGARPPRFPPGSRVDYSNFGFMLLGRIVETVSGQSYDDYIAAHIFAPAHMTATGNQPETVILPHRATGYMKEAGKLVPADPTQPWRGTPAGGGYSTVGDLSRFADALMGGRLLDAAHLKLLTEGGIKGATGDFMRYDFGPGGPPGGGGPNPPRPFFGHGGGAPGMNGELRIYPVSPGHDAAYTIVVLANRDPPAGQALANFIGARVP